MDFRFTLNKALTEQSPTEQAEMLKTLGIERADVTGFLGGSCALSHRELQQLLTFVGYKLVRE